MSLLPLKHPSSFPITMMPLFLFSNAWEQSFISQDAWQFIRRDWKMMGIALRRPGPCAPSP